MMGMEASLRKMMEKLALNPEGKIRWTARPSLRFPAPKYDTDLTRSLNSPTQTYSNKSTND